MFRPRHVALIALAIGAGAAQSADFPARNARFLVGFPPGGAIDTFARVTAQRLGEGWGKQIVVENRPGAGGIIGTELAAKAPADGYTYLFVTVGHVVNPSLYAKLPYDTAGDFTGVAMVATVPNVMVVHPSVPFKSVKDLVDHARQHPKKLTFASSGTATTSHMAAALLETSTGISMTHVPYKGAAPAVQDLVAGRVDLMLDPIISSGGHVKSGRLRALGVTTAKRTPILPDLPTLAEAGVPGYEFEAWFGIIAPAKTPADIVARVNQDVGRLVAAPEVAERLTALGAVPAVAGSPAQMNSFLVRETARWAKVVKTAGIRVE
jgi:tripartite-type tricarboxylate transporter receptor subunit TctC